MKQISKLSRKVLVCSGSVALLFAAGLFAANSSHSAYAAPAASEMMMAGHNVTGVIMDSAGAPAADVPVKLLQKGPDKHGPQPRDPNASPSGDSIIGIPSPNLMGPAMIEKGERVMKTERTDATGHYTFKAVVDGKYSIFAGIGTTAARVDDIQVSGADKTAPDIKLNAK